MAAINRIEKYKFRPFEHPQFFEYYKIAKQNPWTVFELKFNSDKQDWVNYMSEDEKGATTRALTAFNVAEQLIGEYWSGVPEWFPSNPEIIMMARQFSDQESNHLYSYNYLEEVFDLDTFELFKKDEAATQKIENLIDLKADNPDLLTSLAVFSGAVEGCSLFAIFALIVIMCKNNKMNTVKDILGWSAVDEALHSRAGIELYKVKKNEILGNEEFAAYDWNTHKNRVISGFNAVMNCECKFIDYVLPNDLPYVTKEDLKSYLFFLGNQKLIELGINTEGEYSYEVPNMAKAREINRIMQTVVKGMSNSDFFNRKLTDSYTAQVLQDFTTIDYSKKTNLWNEYIA